MWLQWQAALVIAAIGLVVGVAWRRADRPWQRGLALFGLEAALVLVLYTTWILAGRLAIVRVNEGMANGRWVYDLQRDLHLPSETVLQNWILPSPWVVRFTNAYYAVVHVPAMVITLVWLFLSHRERYSRWRTALAITTFACLAIQFIPVAPPRLYPQLGFIDTARLYDQSVYGSLGQGIADQLSAMPSVHVAWAVWVGAVVIDAAVSPWRWLILVHPVATVFAVTATSNHWWLDGVVAVGLLAIAVVVERSGTRLWRARPDGPVDGAVAAARDSPADARIRQGVVGANEALVAPPRPISTSSGSRRSST